MPAGWGWLIAIGALALAVAVVLQVARDEQADSKIESSAEALPLAAVAGLEAPTAINPSTDFTTVSGAAATLETAGAASPAVIDPPALPRVVSPETSASTRDSAAAASEAPVMTNVLTTGIRDVDFGAIPTVGLALRSGGGSIDAGTVRFSDLTGDGTEEALVPISSGGTMGDLAYFVIAMVDEQPEVIFELRADPGVRNASRVLIEAGQLVQLSPLYRPADALCCPAAIEETLFSWSGETFVVQSRQVIEKTTAK
jgi:hypothetical protein